MRNHLKLCKLKSLILLFRKTFKVEVQCGPSAEAPELILIREINCFYSFTIKHECGVDPDHFHQILG